MAGSLPLDDGRYLDRSGGTERVLVVETEGALPPARRRRRRPRKVVREDVPVTVAIAVVTVVRADEPFAGSPEADEWMRRVEDSDVTEALLADAVATLDRARAADAAASGVPFGTPTAIDSILAARVGYGEGDQVASGRFLDALDVDARGGTGGSRRERAARTRPLARTAAILGGRERPAACEILLPRVRLDLSGGNEHAAAISIPAAVEATVRELEFALEDPGHDEDLDRLEGLLPGLGDLASRAMEGAMEEGDVARIEEALEVAERITRRRRILDQ